MKAMRRRWLFPLLTTLAAVGSSSLWAVALHGDEFGGFDLGSILRSHGAEFPRIRLGISQPDVPEMASGSGWDKLKSYATIAPLSLPGLTTMTFKGQSCPLKLGTTGTHLPPEVAICCDRGKHFLAFGGDHAETEPEAWSCCAGCCRDSHGKSAFSGANVHCDSVGSDAFRKYLATADGAGTTLEVRNADNPLIGFSGDAPNFTTSDLEASISVDPRQQAVDVGGEAGGQVDSLDVPSDRNSKNAPESGLLLHRDYSHYTGSRWQVRHLAGQTRFTVASYGNPTGLSSLQQYAVMLQSRGIGSGISHGSPPRRGVEEEYQYIKSLGWPMTVLPDAADFQVDGGKSLEPAHLPLLQLLDSPSVKTAVHFGEWGYYFHELSSSADYFASIYAGKAPSTYAHLMKAPGSKGFGTPPVNRVDAYKQVKSYYMRRNADWDNRLESVTGHSHYEVYAAEWGTPTIGLEIGENIRFTQSKFAFARGASRQWGIPWSSQVSPWFHGSFTTAGPLTGGSGTARGQDAGHSFSFFRRAWLHSWFAGAASLVPEASSVNLFKNGAPDWDLTPLGELAKESFRFMQTRDRGVPYTPVAIILDRYAGYNGFQDKPWGIFDKTYGDQQTYDLFQHQLFPASGASNSPGVANPEAPYLVATPFGESFDVLLTTATSATLRTYPEIVLVGDISFDAGFVNELEAAINSGSRLLLSQTHASSLGSDLARLQAAGTVEILAPWINPATGRATAIANARLDALIELHQPIHVAGNSLQYQTNRNTVGWVVELINNSGVTKVPHLPAVIDATSIADVTLTPLVDVIAAYDWKTGVPFDLCNGSINVSIGPGEVAFVQFVIETAGANNREGLFDRKDSMVSWSRLQQALPPRAGTDGNFVVELDHRMWSDDIAAIKKDQASGNGLPYLAPAYATPGDRHCCCPNGQAETGSRK